MATETKETKAPVRKKRKPVGVRNRFDVINQDPNRVYRLIDSDPDRIAQFVDADWKIEEMKDHLRGGLRADQGTIKDNSVSVGGGKRQVLVSIEREFYEEDQKEKQLAVDAKEAGIKPDKNQGQYQVSKEISRN